jgi:hypothetical protein
LVDGTINIIASEGLKLREVDDVGFAGHGIELCKVDDVELVGHGIELRNIDDVELVGIELRKVDSVELVGRGIAGDDSEGPPFPTLSLRSFLPASAASDALRAGKANQAN